MGVKKLTIDEVSERFSVRGYQLLSTKYVNSKSLLEYLCPEGHAGQICVNNFGIGHGCPICYGNTPKTICEVQKAFDLRGYTLLSDKYSGTHTKLEYLCGNGHRESISRSNFIKGKGCAICAGTRKKTIQEVREKFEDCGYQLLTEKYLSNKQKLDFICPSGHIYFMTFSEFLIGSRCRKCSGNMLKTIDEVRELFKQRNYILLEDKYKGTKGLLKYSCDLGHIHQICVDALVAGNGCPACANHGFNPNLSAILYYIRILHQGEFLYKIGITNRTVEERYPSDYRKIFVVSRIYYDLGKDAYAQEQRIIKRYREFRYKGVKFLKDVGVTEMFDRDVMGLDNKIPSLDNEGIDS